jgi:hypothetical protein
VKFDTFGAGLLSSLVGTLMVAAVEVSDESLGFERLSCPLCDIALTRVRDTITPSFHSE